MDLSELDYIDSAGLAILVEHWRALNTVGGSLVVRHASARVIRLFAITGHVEVSPRRRPAPDNRDSHR